MTSSPVMSTNMVANSAIQFNAQNTQKSNFADFKNFMGQANRKIDLITNDLHGSTPQKDAKAAFEETSAGDMKTDDKVSQANRIKTDSYGERQTVNDDQVDEVSEAIEEVKEVLKEEFELTDEEIEEVLAGLGLNRMALLDTEAVQEVVVEVTGVEDTLSLVTDESVYESLSKVTEAAEDAVKTISEELNIPAEEVEEALKQFETVKPENNITGETPEISEDQENAEEDETIESKVFIVNNESSRKTVSFENKIESIEVTGNVSKEDTKIETDLRKSAQFEQQSSQENSTMSFAQNLFAKVAEALNEEAPQMTYTSFDAQNIMNQLTDFIKVDVSTDNPEVSLRLHPETLGTVSVKISANNEGLLTAQFITQNESVKAVIESQAMVLRENLEAKGVAVEAVEVLVQSHAFERNLNDQNRGQDAEHNNGFAKRTRRITLFDDSEEIQSEEDSLAKEMMIQNGNTVDYSV